MADQATPATAQPGQDPQAQPGQDGAGNELHEQFISSVPEELRDAARQLAPLWDKNVQGKFTEHSDYRKQWEPYESMGVTDIPPQDLQELLNFKQIADDPAKFREWYDEIGTILDPADSETPDYSEEDGDDPLAQHPQFQQMLQQNQQMAQQLQAITEREQQKEQQEKLNAVADEVDTALKAIVKDNPDLDDDAQGWIRRLGSAYAESAKSHTEAIKSGYEDYKKIVAGTEHKMFGQKAATPPPAESGGRADTSAPAVTSFEEAAKIAKERMRQQN